MGHRTLKRVPLNFMAPRGKVWKGYLNTRRGPKKCKNCDGSGYHPDVLWISESFYRHSTPFYRHPEVDRLLERLSTLFGNPSREPMSKGETFPLPRILRRYGPLFQEFCESMRDGDGCWHDKITQDEVEALIKSNRLTDLTHTWEPGKGYQPKQWSTKGFWCPKCTIAVPQLSEEHLTAHCFACDVEMTLLPGDDARLQHVPNAAEVNEREKMVGLRGHDGINRSILIKARAKRLRVPTKCPRCKGKGHRWDSNRARKFHDRWKPIEPPRGEGYQLWETCSEGSPASPVFATAEELADWCAENATVFADEKTSPANWLKMFVGEEDLDTGSLFIMQPGFVGALVNAPK